MPTPTSIKETEETLSLHHHQTTIRRLYFQIHLLPFRFCGYCASS
jgi:hypothetical protein